jgi:AcrR family transcriptional regulator
MTIENKAPARRTRAEQTEKTRRALIEAAAYVVERRGYRDTSIALITQRAKVAQGTFYNYFADRQEILDLLPMIYGERMMGHVARSMDPSQIGAEREVARLVAFLEFSSKNARAARLVNEAATLAPRGYAEYYAKVRAGYERALARSVERGEISRFDKTELKVIVDILLAVRTGLTQQYMAPAKGEGQVPSGVVVTYRKFIERALFAD